MKTEISKFRLRGFQCDTCKTVQKVFGNDPAPETCALSPCIGKPALKWDKRIEQTVTVKEAFE
jgi:hypothetical protein